MPHYKQAAKLIRSVDVSLCLSAFVQMNKPS